MYYYSPNVQRTQISYRSPKTALPRTLLAFVLFSLTLSGVWFTFSHPHGDKPVVAVHQAKAVEAAPKPKAPTISTDEMAARINTIIAANLDTDTGVAITDLTNGQTSHYGLTEVFEAASIGKLITACDFLQQVEHGQRAMNDKIAGLNASEQLRLMIVDSDNMAWHSMNDELTHTSLKSYAVSIGLNTYDPDRNYIGVDDINRLVSKLYMRKLLNTEHTKLLLAHMKIANEAMYIPPAVPKSLSVYHKAGLLDDRVHDAAIITNGQQAYSLVIFTNGHKKYHATDRAELFHQITKATVAHFISSQLQ